MISPPLDPEFKPVSLEMRGYRRAVAESSGASKIAIEVLRGGVVVDRVEERIFSDSGKGAGLNRWAAAQWAKSLQWKTGGDSVRVSGCEALEAFLAGLYAPGEMRSFDSEFFSRVYDGTPKDEVRPAALGGHRQGCRVGFDLGASDRKCAAVRDGEVVFTEEVAWDPASFTDAKRHFDEICDSIRRAAAKLPRLDAIGGSTAGIVVSGEIRQSSLFRGIPADRFESDVRPLFHKLRREFDGVPFAVINDGAVTALAGAQKHSGRSVLGLALGSSLAAGYADSVGHLPDTIDELAFVPIDSRPEAPADAWSGERGCAVQYLSQQGVARLAGLAGKPAEVLRQVQERMSEGDPHARKIYETVGVYLGYALAQFSDLYELGTVLLLGRVMTGPGGAVIISEAERVLAEEFPELSKRVELKTPEERDKRHGQAVAAASLAPGGKDAG